MTFVLKLNIRRRPLCSQMCITAGTHCLIEDISSMTFVLKLNIRRRPLCSQMCIVSIPQFDFCLFQLRGSLEVQPGSKTDSTRRPNKKKETGKQEEDIAKRKKFPSPLLFCPEGAVKCLINGGRWLAGELLMASAN